MQANPKGTVRLELDQEVRKIREGLQRAKYRDSFELEVWGAVSPGDVQRALQDIQPRIVHFCGHGHGNQGLVFVNEQGKECLVSNTALANLFHLVATQVECVVLNACHSHEQAKAIIEQINYVIGTTQAVYDDAAISFTTGFYEALGNGLSIEAAYSWAKNRVELEVYRSSTTLEHEIAVLLKKEPLTHFEPMILASSLETTGTQMITPEPPSNSSASHQSGGISFGNHAQVQGDVFTGDKYGGNLYGQTPTSSEITISKEELLALLKELKTCIKQASMDEEEQDIAVDQISTAIQEANKIEPQNQKQQTDKIGEYLENTKKILDRVKDVGEIGTKAFPILKGLAQILGVSLL